MTSSRTARGKMAAVNLKEADADSAQPEAANDEAAE